MRVLVAFLVMACLLGCQGVTSLQCDGNNNCTASLTMPYRTLGRTGLRVSALSYGAWVTFGTQVSEDQAFEIMEAAFQRGVNFFDNAEAYAQGQAETMMGNVIQRGISQNTWTRSDLVISTKLFWGRKPGRKAGPNEVGLSRKHIIEGMRASLRRLRMEYVDVVFCHRPDPHTPLEETVRAMDYLIARGWTFYWGTSEWPADMIREAQGIAQRLGLVGPVVEQPQYSMLHRERFENEYATLYRDTGYGTTIWSPLASGVLTGKYNEGIPAGSRFSLEKFAYIKKAIVDGNRFGTWEGVISKVKALGEVATELGCSLAQLSLAWCLKNDRVSTVILGGTNTAQLHENLDSLAVLPKLTAEVMERLEGILGNKPEEPYDWTKR